LKAIDFQRLSPLPGIIPEWRILDLEIEARSRKAFLVTFFATTGLTSVPC